MAVQKSKNALELANPMVILDSVNDLVNLLQVN